jgi:hypothetical protein
MHRLIVMLICATMAFAGVFKKEPGFSATNVPFFMEYCSRLPWCAPKFLKFEIQMVRNTFLPNLPPEPIRFAGNSTFERLTYTMRQCYRMNFMAPNQPGNYRVRAVKRGCRAKSETFEVVKLIPDAPPASSAPSPPPVAAPAGDPLPVPIASSV